MKKNLITIIISLIAGIYMGNIMFNQYKIQDETTLPVSLEKSKTLYFLQQGVYSNKENMESNLSSFNYYIYN